MSDRGQKQWWVKPQTGILKLNTDGAFDNDSKKGGWGFIIRDAEGRAVRSGAELLGCYAGLQEAANMDIAQLTLKVDASMVK